MAILFPSLPYLTLLPGWTGSYTCPALRPYQLVPMRVLECNQKVTGSGHKAVAAVKPKPAQENWYRVAICLHEFGQRLVTLRLQILEIFRVIGAEPHHHGKVADLGGVYFSHPPHTHRLFPLPDPFLEKNLICN